ncbi:MAG: hypothetical protein ACR2J6_04435 [Thermoleophilaceae bacterium]
MAQRSSRKRRKQRQRASRPVPTEVAEPLPAERETDADRMARGYARGRAKDEEARAALVPLAPGERPTAVTVAFVVALVAFLANLVALVLNFGDGNGRQSAYTIIGCVLLAVMAAGMWRARYWAVLGMQALLAISVLLASLALVTAVSPAAAVFALLIVGSGGGLFWFLIKAMARIQMPERPGAR